MSWCGVEEPLQCNHQLFSIDEETGELQLSDYLVDDAYRYCFTQLNPGELTFIVESISEQARARLGWAALWKHDDSVRGRVRVSGFRSQGFDVTTLGSIGVARRAFSGIDNDAFRPAGLVSHSRPDALHFLTESDADVFEFLREPASQATLAHGAETGRLAPSREFIERMVGVGLGIAYMSYDQLERPGLVLVRRDKLHLEKLAKAGVVTRILPGADAQQVWRNSSVGT